jgi:hypothetical protein
MLHKEEENSKENRERENPVLSDKEGPPLPVSEFPRSSVP